MIYLLDNKFVKNKALLKQIQMAHWIANNTWSEDSNMILSSHLSKYIYSNRDDNIKELSMYRLIYTVQGYGEQTLEIDAISITDATNKFYATLVNTYSIRVEQHLENGHEMYRAKTVINNEHFYEHLIEAYEPYQVAASFLADFCKVVGVEQLNPGFTAP